MYIYRLLYDTQTVCDILQLNSVVNSTNIYDLIKGLLSRSRSRL